MFNYRGEHYFHYYLGYSSCFGCVVYRCDGQLVDTSDFVRNGKNELLDALSGGIKTTIWGVLE